MKKFIIILIIITFLITGYYFVIENDILDLKAENLKIMDLEILNIELLRNKIYTDHGIVSYSDKSIKTTNYKGITRWSKEIEDFISSVYFYDNIYIVTENKHSIIEIDINGNILNQYNFDSEILKVEKGNDIYVILNSEEDNNKAVKIIDGEKEELKINGNIVFLSPIDKIDSYLIGYFYFSNGKINSVIQQRLIKDDIKRWEIILEGDLIIDVKQTSSRNFILTQKNFYTFNTDGIILWKYNNFENVRDLQIDEKNSEIIILDDKNLHIINYDSSVENIIQLDQEYEQIKIHNNNILLQNTSSLVVVDEENYPIWINDERIKNYYIINDNIYIETDFNFYVGRIR